MRTERKVTVSLPEELMANAMKASGEGLTSTLKRGLELVAAKSAYRKLLKLKGTFDLQIDLDELRKDGH